MYIFVKIQEYTFFLMLADVRVWYCGRGSTLLSLSYKQTFMILLPTVSFSLLSSATFLIYTARTIHLKIVKYLYSSMFVLIYLFCFPLSLSLPLSSHLHISNVCILFIFSHIHHSHSTCAPLFSIFSNRNCKSHLMERIVSYRNSHSW